MDFFFQKKNYFFLREKNPKKFFVCDFQPKYQKKEIFFWKIEN